MSDNPRFRRRLRRLIVVSALMLGLITVLAAVTTEVSVSIVAILASGWILMPSLLYAGLDRPRVRYLLIIPATLVTAGLVSVARAGQMSPAAELGWWLITAGVLMGGGLGAWFWYRWIPVPESLDDPFSASRTALIAIHVVLILGGIGFVIGG